VPSIQGSYSFELLKFHDFPWPFPWLFKVSHDLNLTIFLGNFQKFSWFRVRFTLFLTKNNLPNLFCTINTIFHDFPWPTLKFHDFPGLENEILKFHDFPGFPWPVRTLCIGEIWCWSLLGQGSFNPPLVCLYYWIKADKFSRSFHNKFLMSYFAWKHKTNWTTQTPKNTCLTGYFVYACKTKLKIFLKSSNFKKDKNKYFATFHNNVTIQKTIKPCSYIEYRISKRSFTPPKKTHISVSKWLNKCARREKNTNIHFCRIPGYRCTAD